MKKVRLLYYAKLFFELLRGATSVILIALIGTYVLGLAPYSKETIRYAVLAIFLLMMIIVLIAIYVLRNYQLIIKSSRVFVLGISMFAITELLRVDPLKVTKMIEVILPTTTVLCGISIMCIFLYFAKIEDVIFSKEFMEKKELNVNLENPETIKRSIQEDIAKGIKSDLKGNIGIKTEDIVYDKKKKRQAIVGVYLTDKEVPKKLFEIPVNL